MRRPPSDLILVLCARCEARLPLSHARAPSTIRCGLCGGSNEVPKLLRPRRRLSPSTSVR